MLKIVAFLRYLLLGLQSNSRFRQPRPSIIHVVHAFFLARFGINCLSIFRFHLTFLQHRLFPCGFKIEHIEKLFSNKISLYVRELAALAVNEQRNFEGSSVCSKPLFSFFRQNTIYLSKSDGIRWEKKLCHHLPTSLYLIRWTLLCDYFLIFRGWFFVRVIPPRLLIYDILQETERD